MISKQKESLWGKLETRFNLIQYCVFVLAYCNAKFVGIHTYLIAKKYLGLVAAKLGMGMRLIRNVPFPKFGNRCEKV